ncbi:hypothetical protein Tco_0564754 [Tanacetum coccineum]
MTTKAQQSALDNALVSPENQRVIGKCNMRINPGMKPKEPTYQVVLDTLALTTCYHAFLITTEVPVFREILNICPRISGQEFDEPPSEEEALSFIPELGHYGEIKYITNVSGLDKIRLSIVQILWGMYYKKNLDFVALIWEDLANQIDNKDSMKQDKMFYPRFTKITIHHFLEKHMSISIRNRTFMHIARDDILLGSMIFVSRYEDTQALVKADRGKSLNDLLEVALSEDVQLKEATKQSKKDFHISHASDSGDRTNFQLGVPDEQQRKISGDSGEDDEDDTKDDKGNDNADDSEGNDDDDDDGDDGDDGDDNDNDDSDHGRTESDRDENLNLNQFNEEHEEEEKKYVNVKLRKEDVEMTNADQGGADQHNVTQESGFEQEEEDAHVTLTTVHDIQKTEADNEIASLMDTTVHNEEPSGQTSTLFSVPIIVIPTTIPPPPHFFNPLPQQATPTPTPITSEATTLFLALPDFASIFRFNDRVTNLERDLIEMKQVDQEEAQAKKHEYIDLIDTLVRTIFKEEVKTQLPQILPKAVSDFATHVIERSVIESLEVEVLAKSSSQPKSTYEAVESLSEYELTKILLDKIEESKSHIRADYNMKLYNALFKSFNIDKDLFETYGEVFTLKRSRDEKDKDQGPFVGSDRGTKRRKSSKEAESQKDPRSKEGKSSSSSKDTSCSHHKSSGKSAYAEEPSHTVDDFRVQKNQEFDTVNNDEQPDDETAPKNN